MACTPNVDRYPRKWNGKVELDDENGELVVLDAEVTIQQDKPDLPIRVTWKAEGLYGEFFTSWRRWGNGLACQVRREVNAAFLCS